LARHRMQTPQHEVARGAEHPVPFACAGLGSESVGIALFLTKAAYIGNALCLLMAVVAACILRPLL